MTDYQINYDCLQLNHEFCGAFDPTDVDSAFYLEDAVGRRENRLSKEERSDKYVEGY